MIQLYALFQTTLTSSSLILSYLCLFFFRSLFGTKNRQHDSHFSTAFFSFLSLTNKLIEMQIRISISMKMLLRTTRLRERAAKGTGTEWSITRGGRRAGLRKTSVNNESNTCNFASFLDPSHSSSSFRDQSGA